MKKRKFLSIQRSADILVWCLCNMSQYHTGYHLSSILLQLLYHVIPNPQAKPEAGNKTLKQLMETLLPNGAWPLTNQKDVLFTHNFV